jgi:hypothetical protein
MNKHDILNIKDKCKRFLVKLELGLWDKEIKLSLLVFTGVLFLLWVVR